MKTMMLATASALLFATAASAGERVQLSETQLDNVTAGAIFGLAIGGNLGGGAGNGTGSLGKFSAKNINRVTSKTTIGAGTTPTTFNDEVYSEQTASAEGAGGAGALALGIQAGAAVYLSTP